MATKPTSKPDAIEAEITELIAASGIRLRFDRVALRLVNGLKASVAQTLPTDESIVFTITAPLKHPAKTSATLEGWLRDLPDGELRATIHGNEVRARRVTSVASHMPKVLGFVHNPQSDADLILNFAESRLRER